MSWHWIPYMLAHTYDLLLLLHLFFILFWEIGMFYHLMWILHIREWGSDGFRFSCIARTKVCGTIFKNEVYMPWSDQACESTVENFKILSWQKGGGWTTHFKDQLYDSYAHTLGQSHLGTSVASCPTGFREKLYREKCPLLIALQARGLLHSI